MSGDRYYISDQNAIYYVTFTVVDWVDVFTRPSYKQIIVDNLNYCTEKKGLNVFAWCLMTNHLHAVIQAREPATDGPDGVRDYPAENRLHTR